VVCAEASRECEFRGTMVMDRWAYLTSLWVCMAAVQAQGRSGSNRLGRCEMGPSEAEAASSGAEGELPAGAG